MRLQYVVTTVVAVVACTSAAFAQQPQPAGPRPGNMVVVHQPAAVQAAVGDLIQIRVPNTSVVQNMISNLQVQVQGDAVNRVAVINTSERIGGLQNTGGGSLSVFLVATQPGQATVRVIPQLNQGGTGQPQDYQVQVGQQVQP